MSDKIVPIHNNLKRNSGRKLIEMQVMNYSQMCLQYAEFTKKVIEALDFSPKDVALSSIFKFQYIVADRYVLGFEKYHYYVDAGTDIHSGIVLGVCVFDTDIGDDEPEGWGLAIAEDSIITLPDPETQEYIIREINRGNVENG